VETLFLLETLVITYATYTAIQRRRSPDIQRRMLRRIFGPQKDELTGGRRKLHNEERDEMGWACSTYSRDEKCLENHSPKTRRKETTLET
jgi:hypothetical protein